MATGASIIRKRSPLEQAIAETTDRRARYEKAQRERGLVKTTVWVRSDVADDVRAVVRILNETNGDKRAALGRLLDEWTRRG